MASPAAQQMLNSLPPAEQQRVLASIAGNPNGLDDWYQNAAKAGDPRAIRAGGAGQSEDFERFNEGTLTGWSKQYYDEAASRAAGRPQFRSMRGEQGFFDKPTECPPGMGPSGPNETDPCTTKGYSEPAGGAPGQAATATTSPTGPSQSQLEMSMLYSPLRDLLANQGHFLGQFDPVRGDGRAGVQGGIMGGGGMWWSPTQGQPATAPIAQTGGLEPKPPTLAPVTPTQIQQTGGLGPARKAPADVSSGSPATSNPFQALPTQNTSSLTGVLAPLQGQTAPTPLSGTLAPLQAGRRKSPLTDTLMNNQANRWF